MKLHYSFSDTFLHGPDGHPTASVDYQFTELEFREAIKTHIAYRGANAGVIYLRGETYPRASIIDVPEELFRLVSPDYSIGGYRFPDEK